jgi:hypothetical protein
MRRLGAAVAVVPLLFAAVMIWRKDLVVQAWTVTAQTFSRGGPGRRRLLGEIALFAGILAATWRLLAGARPRPAHQAAVAIAAGALGWIAEAWGTRLGIWHYYTGEAPPLWIVPAWSLGALVIERLAENAGEKWARPVRPHYWTAVTCALATIVWFSGPRLTAPAAWSVPAAIVLVLTARARDGDFWFLTAGFGAVFFADLWGTTNGCWAYYRHALPGGVAQGIAFGMAFDSAVALAALRLVRALGL